MPLDLQIQLAGGLALSFWTLLAAGLLGGLSAGLLGVGGGILVTPLLISLGVPARIAAGSMNVAIIGNAADALAHDLPRRRVDWRMGLWMGLAAAATGQAGTWAIGQLGRPRLVDALVRAGFLALLLVMAWRLLRRRGPREGRLRRWLFSAPLRYHSPWESRPVSPLPAMAAALGGGLVASLLGVGGGIIYVPVLLALFPRPLQDLVPVSQIAVLLGTLSVSSGHVWHTGNIDPRLALVLVLTGALGTAAGSRLKARLDSRLLERLLALVLLLAALRLSLPLPQLDLAAAGTAARDPLAGLAAWCARGVWQNWLGTVGLALALSPLLSRLQHAVLDRINGRQSGQGVG